MAFVCQLLARSGAEAKRVNELLEILGALPRNSHTSKLSDAERIEYIKNHSTLKIESLSISIPFTNVEHLSPMGIDSMVLVRDLSISLAQGSSLIITGREMAMRNSHLVLYIASQTVLKQGRKNQLVQTTLINLQYYYEPRSKRKRKKLIVARNRRLVD